MYILYGDEGIFYIQTRQYILQNTFIVFIGYVTVHYMTQYNRNNLCINMKRMLNNNSSNKTKDKS